MAGTFENDSKAFNDFLSETLKYEISPKIAIHDYRSDHQGRGVIASEDIEEDEVLFKIPRSSFLSVENDPDFVKQVPETKKLNSWLQLILYMMQAGSMEKWKPYFDVLPTQLDSLMMWNDEELDGLKGSMIVKKIGKSGAEEDYQEKLKPIIDAHPDYFKDCDTSLESFHRMGGLIMAYSFDAPDSFSDDEEDDEDIEHDDLYSEGLVKAMVPLADTLNAHTRFCNANLIAEDDGGFSMTAVKPIKKGEQVYNTYGELPNCDFLRRYGYVENEGTEFDIVEFSMDEISDFYASKSSKELIEEATDLLEEWQGEYEILDEYFVVGKEGEIEFDLACFISFLELITKDTSLLSKLKQDKSLRKQVVKQLWKKSNQGLIIDDAVKSVTDLVETKKKTYGEKSEKSHKHKMAGVVLDGELEILDNIVKRLPETTTYTADDIISKKRASDAPSGDAKRKK